MTDCLTATDRRGVGVMALSVSPYFLLYVNKSHPIIIQGAFMHLSFFNFVLLGVFGVFGFNV